MPFGLPCGKAESVVSIPNQKPFKIFQFIISTLKKRSKNHGLLFLDSRNTLWLAITNSGALYQFDRKQKNSFATVIHYAMLLAYTKPKTEKSGEEHSTLFLRSIQEPKK